MFCLPDRDCCAHLKINIMAKFGKNLKEPTKNLKEKRQEKISKKIEEKMNKKRKKR